MRPMFGAALLFATATMLSLAQNNQATPTSIGPTISSSIPADEKSRESAEINSEYVPVHKFDPKRDAAADIRAAISEAQRTGKRVILDVGGDWCAWCHVLDKFFETHPEIVSFRDRNFLTVAVFYSHENKNEKVLSQYGKVEGIPHFFVLDKDGTLLHSQGMVKLETGGEPDPEKMKDFLVRWSPPHPDPEGATKTP